MKLIRLKATNFRNFTHLDIEPSDQINLIYGANGSGKSSIIEAIYFLALGRSFRSHLVNRVIRYEEESLTVFGMTHDQAGIPIPLGVEKPRDGKIRIKISNETTAALSELAKILPVQLINPDSYQLFTEGPKQRRQFLDWGVFHVEHSFFNIWQRFQRVLKQRNSALQQGLSNSHIKAWDNEFVATALSLAELRRGYVDRLKPVVLATLGELIELSDLTINYHPGWDTKKDLNELLDAGIMRDRSLGYTHMGPQRADLLIKVNNIPVEDVLSRGEQKLLVCALQLAQGIVLSQAANKRCIYLLDDIAAELDDNRREKIIGVMQTLKSQVFVTAVDTDALKGLVDNDATKLFHVEQGSVAVVKNN